MSTELGQEIIVRVMHRGRGRVARRLVRLVPDAPEGPPETVPSTCDALIGPEGEREIGHITSAAFSPRMGHVIASAS